MWPKMLLELLPHFARLVPMADKFFSTRTASERAQEAALAALAADVRGELGKAAEAHTGVQRQLQEQSQQISETAVEVTRARMSVESVEVRVARLEKTAGTTMRLLLAVMVLVAVALGILVVKLMP
jgi:chromosome segregation ATPase